MCLTNPRLFKFVNSVILQVTLQTVHDAEDLVTVLKVKVDDSRRALQLLRLQLREEKKEVMFGMFLKVRTPI